MDVRSHVERVQTVAAKQGGRVARTQLIALGLGRGRIENWVRRGLLIPTLPGVFAVGYRDPSRTSQLWDAVLYAGPDASLTGVTGCFHIGLLFYPPDRITAQTPRRCKSLPQVRVLQHRTADRRFHTDGLPIAPTPELLIALSVETNSFKALAVALSNLEFRRELDIAALRRICARGRNGSALLKRALTNRIPQLARVKSDLEVDFLLLLEAHHLLLPAHVNEKLHGEEPDMYWPELRLVVELDGIGNHGTAAQQRRDRAKDEKLRGYGLTVIRLTYDDVCDPSRIRATLGRLAAHGVHKVA